MRERTWLVPAKGGPPIEVAGELCLVGRQPDCDIQLDDKTVSKMHCALARLGGVLMYRDLGSTNGCRVNGARQARGELREGDLLTIAGFDFRVHFGAPPAELPRGREAIDRTEMLPAPPRALQDSA